MPVRFTDLVQLYGEAGTREKFEQLCAVLVRSKYPDAKGIRVQKGDGGIDVYSGDWANSGKGIHVFQVKFFPNGVKESQKAQIRDSFKQCARNTNFKTATWTLCLPLDLSIEEENWFSQWATDMADVFDIQIDYWGETALLELLYDERNHGIKEEFFKEEQPVLIRGIDAKLNALLSTARNKLATLEPYLEEVISLYLYQCYKEDRFANLDQAGEIDPEYNTSLSQIFINSQARIREIVISPQLSFNDPQFNYSQRKAQIETFLLLKQKNNITTHQNSNPLNIEQLSQNLPPFKILDWFLLEDQNEEVTSIETHRTLLIGGPGQGKSTIGQYLSQLHRKSLLTRKGTKIDEKFEFEVQKPRIPFRIILKNFAQWLADKNKDRAKRKNPKLNFEQYLNSQLRQKTAKTLITNDDVQRIFRSSPCLLILDGLDEVVVPEIESQMLDLIGDFLDRMKVMKANLAVLATSRPTTYTYKQQFHNLDFLSLELLPLNPDEALAFADKWVKAKRLIIEEQTRILDIFKDCLRDSAIAPLLTTPLQTMLVLILIKDGGRPPSEREALFQEYWNITYRRERSKANNILPYSESQLFNLHAYLGYLLHKQAASASNVQSLLTEVVLTKAIKDFLEDDDESKSKQELEKEAKALLESARKRLVLIDEQEPNLFGFKPRSIQEFFAAVHLISTAKNSNERFEKLRELVDKPHWSNVALLLVGRFMRTLGGEASSISVEVCIPLDRTTSYPLLKPGAWFALEVLADGAVKPNSNLGRALFQHGLTVFDTGISAEQGQRLWNIFQRLQRLSNTISLTGLVEEKAQGFIRFSSWLCLSKLLTYTSNYGQNWLLSKANFENAVKALLNTGKSDLTKLAWERISNSDILHEEEWLYKLCEQYNKGWQYYLYKWWLFSISGRVANELLSRISLDENRTRDISDGILEYDQNHGNGHTDLFYYLKPAPLSYEAQIMVLLNTKAIIDEWGQSSKGIEISFGNLGSFILQRPNVEDGTPYQYEIYNYGVIEPEEWAEIINRTDLLPNIQLTLWLLYWSENEPTLSRSIQFLDYIEKLQTEGEISLSFWDGYWLCKWPLLNLAVKLQLAYGRKYIEKLIPYLDTPAHDEVARQVIETLEKKALELSQVDGELTIQQDTYVELRAGMNLSPLLPELQAFSNELGLRIEELIAAHLIINQYYSQFYPQLRFTATQLDHWFALATQQVRHIERLLSLVQLLALGAWPTISSDVAEKGRSLLTELITAWGQRLNSFQTNRNCWLFPIEYLDVVLVVLGKLEINCNQSGLSESYAPQILRLSAKSPFLAVGDYSIKVLTGLPPTFLAVFKDYAKSEDEELKLGAVRLWRLIVKSGLYYRRNRDFYPETALEKDQRIIGTRQDAENGLSLVIQNSTTPDSHFYLGGVALLTWSDFPFDDIEFTEKLDKSMQKAGELGSPEVDEAWKHFIAEVPVSKQRQEKWQDFLTHILEIPEKYPTLVPEVAMERYLKLAITENNSIE